MNDPNGLAGLRERVAKLEAKTEAMLQLIDERKDSNRVALELARSGLEHRLETMNEFRHQIEKERVTYVTEKELALRFDVLRKELKPLQDRYQFTKGRDWALGAGVVIISAAIALAVRFL